MSFRIETATSSGQISTDNDAVLVIEFHARSTNSGPVYVGKSNVGETEGRELPPGESFTMNFALPDIGRHAGRVLLSGFYVSVPDGNAVDWSAIIRDPAA